MDVIHDLFCRRRFNWLSGFLDFFPSVTGTSAPLDRGNLRYRSASFICLWYNLEGYLQKSVF
jgi:hypothetical protein